jgi:hypothetical protein
MIPEQRKKQLMDNELKVTLEKHWNPNNTGRNKHNDD